MGSVGKLLLWLSLSYVSSLGATGSLSEVHSHFNCGYGELFHKSYTGRANMYELFMARRIGGRLDVGMYVPDEIVEALNQYLANGQCLCIQSESHMSGDPRTGGGYTMAIGYPTGCPRKR